MIGAKLRALRKGKELTLADVAKQTGLSVSFLSDIERERTQPSFDTLQKLADFYQVEFDALVIDAEVDLQESRDGYPSGLGEFLDDVEVDPELVNLLRRVERRARKRAETKEDWMKYYYSLKAILGE